MNNVTIIDKAEIVRSPAIWVALIITLSILFGIMLSMIKHNGTYLLVLLCFGILGGTYYAYKNPEEHGRMQYVLSTNEKTDFCELTKGYDVIAINGDTWIVQDKKEN